jgi:hypothetical protein
MGPDETHDTGKKLRVKRSGYYCRVWDSSDGGRNGQQRGRKILPLCCLQLHLCDFDALVRAYFNAAHAPNALTGLEWVGLPVGAHLIHLYRTDVDALTTASAAIHVDVN